LNRSDGDRGLSSHAEVRIRDQPADGNGPDGDGVRVAAIRSATNFGYKSRSFMKITFCGAAGEVTGSQHLLEFGRRRILLDCGLFQGHRAESRRKNEKFLHKPDKLDAVILSHAHIDHCGNLPGLYRDEFRGPVYCTDATADVADIMLVDSIHIQEEDANHLNKRRPRGEPLIEPLYVEKDMRGIVRQFEPCAYNEWQQIFPELRVRFREAGHIIGSAICELEFQEKGETRRLVFTGDLGRRELPLLRDPELVNGCDILITESTYGNRVHPPADNIKHDLRRIIQHAVEKKGKVIIPAFSLGRTQQLVYFLNELTNSGELPRVPVFVDSPLSNRITAVFRRHAHVFDEHVQKTLVEDTDAFGFQGLTYVSRQQESMELNHRPGPFVVIAASGMCESGRVLHHLKHGVDDAANTIVMIGFQAEHTLGRRIQNRQPFVKIFDREYPLRATVEILEGLSAHADVNDFKWWFEHLASKTGVGQAFLVHGEPESSQALAGLLKDYCDLDPIIPQRGQSFEV
jgi:metallo-beta-lactamase family protein